MGVYQTPGHSGEAKPTEPVGSSDTAEVDSLEVEDHVWYSSAHQC